MSRLREERSGPMSRLREERSGAMSRLREERSGAMSRRRLRRRLSAGLLLLAGLLIAGGLAATLTPKAQVAVADESALALVRNGKQIYETSCISCHGANLQGLTDRGPSLLGVGEAAVYFQVHTGRMPLTRQEADAQQKPPVFSDAEIDQLMAFVQTHGGGPTVPSGDLRDGDLAQGGELFRLNCASCHNFVGEGGALSSGKSAPSLQNASDLEIYAAMLTGPENMPVFGDNQLTPQDKRSIINYIQTVKTQADPGGAGIGRIGPVSEGLVIWVVGIGIMMFGVFWMGSKA